MNLLLRDNIIFTDKTLSYSKINDLFNAADLYISPYLAEGFNLTSLEALSAGLPVMISSTGSTKEYMLDIYNNGGSEYIFYIDSEVIDVGEGKRQNNIDFMKLLHLVTDNEKKIIDLKNSRINGKGTFTKDFDKRQGNVEKYRQMKSYIEENYSWNKVAQLLYDYFSWIKTN